MRDNPGRTARSAYSPERANSSAVSRYANGRIRSVSCSAGVTFTLPSTAALSTSAVKIASATAAKSSASSDSTRASRRAVARRSRNDSAGGRLRRMSRSEESNRSVVSDSTARAAIDLARNAAAPVWRTGRSPIGGDSRSLIGADVLVERGPISLLTTPQTRRCSGQSAGRACHTPARGICAGTWGRPGKAVSKLRARTRARPEEAVREAVRARSTDEQLDAGLLDRALQPVPQRHLRRPAEQLARPRDVGLALLG